MKTILVLTDFTAEAENAALYAYQFAKLIKAKILLFNAFGIPQKNAIASQVTWPVSDEISQDSMRSLKLLASKLRSQSDGDQGFVPDVAIDHGFGAVADLASAIVIQKAIGLVVISGPKSTKVNRMLFGSDTHDLLDKVLCPVLLVPNGVKYATVKRITYATDLRSADAAVLDSLSVLAALFEAEVSITHVSDRSVKEGEEFSHQLLSTTAYPKVNYQHLKGRNVVASLCNMNSSTAEQIEMLVLVHKKYHFPESLFHTSISKQIANFATVPVIIYPYTFITSLSQPK